MKSSRSNPGTVRLAAMRIHSLGMESSSSVRQWMETFRGACYNAPLRNCYYIFLRQMCNIQRQLCGNAIFPSQFVCTAYFARGTKEGWSIPLNHSHAELFNSSESAHKALHSAEFNRFHGNWGRLFYPDCWITQTVHFLHNYGLASNNWKIIIKSSG